MAETERKHLGQLRADNPSPGGIIPPDAILHWAKALTAGQPQNGVNSYGGTTAELLQFIASNMETVVFPSLSWVPEFSTSGGTIIPTNTSSVEAVRIGNLVFLRALLRWDSRPNTTDALRLSLPAPSDGNQFFASAETESMPGTTEAVLLQARGTHAEFREANQWPPRWVQAQNLAESGAMFINGFYRAS